MFSVWHPHSNDLSSEIGLHHCTYYKSGASQTRQSYSSFEIVLGGQLTNIPLMMIEKADINSERFDGNYKIHYNLKVKTFNTNIL